MPELNSVSTVVLISLFILPGYMIKSILSTARPEKKDRDAAYYLSCLFYSLINCAVWSWAYFLVSSWAFSKSSRHPILFWVYCLAITLIGALLLSLAIVLLRYLKKSERLTKLFDKMDLNTVHPIPTAWDYCFSRRQGNWVIVTLNDGSIVRGLFSSGSFASSEADERDMFIEDCYGFNQENNEWIENKSSDGVYISASQIKTIEFLKYQCEAETDPAESVSLLVGGKHQ